jgi:hypothetical protein
VNASASMTKEQADKFAASWGDNEHHSKSVRVLASSKELDRRLADAAHRRFGEAVMELEEAERNLARLFQTVEACEKDMLKAGSRAEPDYDRLPLLQAAHNAWMTDRVGAAPVRGV